MKPLLSRPICGETALTWYRKLGRSGLRPRPCANCGHDLVFETPWAHRGVEVAGVLGLPWLKPWPWLFGAALVLLLLFDLALTLFVARLRVANPPGLLGD